MGAWAGSNGGRCALLGSSVTLRKGGITRFLVGTQLDNVVIVKFRLIAVVPDLARERCLAVAITDIRRLLSRWLLLSDGAALTVSVGSIERDRSWLILDIEPWRSSNLLVQVLLALLLVCSHFRI